MKRIGAILALILIFSSIGGALFWGGKAIYQAYGTRITQFTFASPKDAKGFLAPQSVEAPVEKQIRISEQLAARIEKNGRLPEHSPMGIALLGESKESNKAAFVDQLETLAADLGSSQILGTIRTLRQNREALLNLESLLQSSDPNTVQAASEKKKALEADNLTLQANLKEVLNREGFAFTDEQVSALCASDNAEDTVSMIAAFHSLHVVNDEMERRLRTMPTPDNAQKYYAAHCALLQALARIQVNSIRKITEQYIPRAMDIEQKAGDVLAAGQKLQSDNPRNSEDSLPPTQVQALQFNKMTNEKTIARAKRTMEKLEKNRAILERSHAKLTLFIRAARNSYNTMKLHNESIQLDMEQTRDFDEIQALTLPEMAAINFADPEHPEVVRPTYNRH